MCVPLLLFNHLKLLLLLLFNHIKLLLFNHVKLLLLSPKIIIIIFGQLSIYGSEFVKNANKYLKIEGEEDDVDLQFQELGYLFLSSKEGKGILETNCKTQRDAGVKDVKMYNNKELGVKFPWLNTDNIELGSFGEKGGNGFISL